MLVEKTIQGIPGGPVVRTWCFSLHDPGSIRGQGTKILQATWRGQKNKRKQNKRLSFLHLTAFAPWSKINWLYSCGSISGLSILFHGSVYSFTKDLHTMFTAALFIITETWKQPKCPLIGEWINKLWHIHKMEYYSAKKKRNELSSHEKTCKNIKWSYWKKLTLNYSNYMTFWKRQDYGDSKKDQRLPESPGNGGRDE